MGHVPDPATLVNPGGQAVQVATVAPPVENGPALQSPFPATDEAPPEQNLPAGQVPDPAAEVDPARQYTPAGQAVQDDVVPDPRTE